MNPLEKKYDCQRGCCVRRNKDGSLDCKYEESCCKRESHNWLTGMPVKELDDLFEVRFKNTRKDFYKNNSGQALRKGDFVVTEAKNGYDVGIVTLSGALIENQLKRSKINPAEVEFKKIYRKAKQLDLEKLGEAVAREHKTMIRSREIVKDLGLDMKIGDVEFQGDGTKAIFYYIADKRVDFRQLIQELSAEFHIRVEMKQIGVRQEAGLIGGIGVCGQELCCSRYIRNFRSISTSVVRCQDLSMNPQKLAGHCGKLKCCLNYEATVYIDAKKRLPKIKGPLHLEDGDIYLQKSDVLTGIMWFSYEKRNNEAYPLGVEKVRSIIALNAEDKPGASLANLKKQRVVDFRSDTGEESITRFDSLQEIEKRNKKGGIAIRSKTSSAKKLKNAPRQNPS